LTTSHGNVPASRAAWLDREARCYRQGHQAILFGPGAAGPLLARELRRRGISRVVILAGQSSAVRAVPAVVDAGLRDLEVVQIVSGVPQHSPADWTESLAGSLADQRIDAIVSVGGGSASDAAKALALLLAAGGKLSDWWFGNKNPATGGLPGALPVIAVPTTLSGAELTSGAGVLSGHTKHTLWSPAIAATVVAYDDDVLAQSDPRVLLATGMNAIAHCAEGLYSPEVNRVVTALAQAAAADLASGLRKLAGEPTPTSPYGELAAGAAMSGLVLGMTRVGLHHGVCHALGSVARVPHGAANAVMLPHVLSFNASHSAQGQAVLASALGQPGETASLAVSSLAEQIGTPRTLREIGVGRELLEPVALEAMADPALAFNPRPVTLNDLESLLNSAY
jgi:alcohol dehydrogenase class IV